MRIEGGETKLFPGGVMKREDSQFDSAYQEIVEKLRPALPEKVLLKKPNEAFKIALKLFSHVNYTVYKRILTHDFGDWGKSSFFPTTELYERFCWRRPTNVELPDWKKWIRLGEIGKEALTLVGKRFDLPPIETRDGPIEWFAHITTGIWEGIIEIQFVVKKPKYFTEDVFAQKDVFNKSISDRISENIPIWTTRLNPAGDRATPTMLISAIQRITSELNTTPINKMKNADKYLKSFQNGSDKTPQSTLKDFFKYVIETHFTRESNRYVLPNIYFLTEYLFKAIPGNFAIDRIERKLSSKIENCILTLSIQILQSLGYKSIRFIDEQQQQSIQHHRSADKIQESFSYNELGSLFFTPDGNPNYPRHPFNLSHQGTSLGLTEQARKSLSPELIQYLMSVDIKLQNST